MALSDHLRAKDWTYSATSLAGQRRVEFALKILLTSLAVFFAAAVVGYLLMRFEPGRPRRPVQLPAILWLSTAFALSGSFLLRKAVRSVARERQRAFKRQLSAAFVLGVGFCVTQSIGLSAIFRDHLEVMRERPAQVQTDQAPLSVALRAGVRPSAEAVARSMAPKKPIENRLEGLLSVMILLHGLHFTGGLVALATVTRRGLAGRYDHEYHAGVRLCALYWRFLDVVWLIMFGMFLLTSPTLLESFRRSIAA